MLTVFLAPLLLATSYGIAVTAFARRDASSSTSTLLPMWIGRFVGVVALAVAAWHLHWRDTGVAVGTFTPLFPLGLSAGASLLALRRRHRLDAIVAAGLVVMTAVLVGFHFVEGMAAVDAAVASLAAEDAEGLRLAGHSEVRAHAMFALTAVVVFAVPAVIAFVMTTSSRRAR